MLSYMKVFVALVLSLALITATTTTMYKVNTAKAFAWAIAADIGISLVGKVVKKVFTKENNPTAEKIQQAKRIAGEAIQETKNLCTVQRGTGLYSNLQRLGLNLLPSSSNVCRTVNQVQVDNIPFFKRFTQRGINQLPASDYYYYQPPGQQQGFFPPGYYSYPPPGQQQGFFPPGQQQGFFPPGQQQFNPDIRDHR
jgi:hypothetical protein